MLLPRQLWWPLTFSRNPMPLGKSKIGTKLSSMLPVFGGSVISALVAISKNLDETLMVDPIAVDCQIKPML